MNKLYTETIASDIVFPHITVRRLLRDGEVYGYRANADDGYVMYDPNANDVEIDIDMLETPVTYYYTTKGFTVNYNFGNFPWVAVPRNDDQKIM